jgi:hypothetical protein
LSVKEKLDKKIERYRATVQMANSWHLLIGTHSLGLDFKKLSKLKDADFTLFASLWCPRADATELEVMVVWVLWLSACEYSRTSCSLTLTDSAYLHEFYFTSVLFRRFLESMGLIQTP